VQDEAVFLRLARDFGSNVAKDVVDRGADAVRAAYPGGFEVVIEGRSLWLIPVANVPTTP
jgi:hypothetical protein